MLKKLLLAMLVFGTAVMLTGRMMALASPAQPTALQPAAVTGASANYQISWDVNANGGETMSSASYTMLSTTGQVVDTTMGGSTYTMKNGFWHGVFRAFKLFLPMITKG